MRKAFSYVRFSTPDQAKGDSFRRQTEFSQKYAEKHGLTLDESTSIRDLGASAFRGSNVKEGALAAFLELARSGKVPVGSVLIVESLDRLSRDQIRPALQLFLSILDSGVSIVTVHPEREYTPADQDPMTLIEPLIYFSRAHEESATKSKRISENWEQKRKAAVEKKTPMTSVCPKWLEVKEGKFVPVPERVELVKRIFRLTLEGMGTYFVIKKLTEEGIKGWGRNGKWNTAYVRMILVDRRVLGEYQPKKLVEGKMQNHGERILDYFPRVISDQDFYAALGTIKKRKGKAGRGGAFRENVLSGLVYNAEDGSSMAYGTHRHLKPFLSSTASYNSTPHPKGRSFPYQLVEEAVLSLLPELQVTTEAAFGCVDRIAELEGRIGELNVKIEKLSTSLMNCPAVAFDELLTVFEALGRERKELGKQLEQEKRAAEARAPQPPVEPKTLIEVRRASVGECRKWLNAKLRNGIQVLVERITIRIEKRSRVEKAARIEVKLKSGECRSSTVLHPPPPLQTEARV